MAERVTDEIVRSVLTWARNYGEIASFKSIAPRGRRWQVTLPKERIVGSGFWITGAKDVVPEVMVFTSREALAFAYGCAAGGIHDRAAFAREKWGWD